MKIIIIATIEMPPDVTAFATISFQLSLLQQQERNSTLFSLREKSHRRMQREAELVANKADGRRRNPPLPPPRRRLLKHNMSLPIVVVHNAETAENSVISNAHRKHQAKKKPTELQQQQPSPGRKERSHSICSIRVLHHQHEPPPVPPRRPKLSKAPIQPPPAPTTTPPPPPPPLIIQEPPTPTTPASASTAEVLIVDDFMEGCGAEDGAVVESAPQSLNLETDVKVTTSSAAFNLPTIHLPDEIIDCIEYQQEVEQQQQQGDEAAPAMERKSGPATTTTCTTTITLRIPDEDDEDFEDETAEVVETASSAQDYHHRQYYARKDNLRREPATDIDDETAAAFSVIRRQTSTSSSASKMQFESQDSSESISEKNASASCEHKSRSRKRRRSLVNLLFPPRNTSSGEASSSAATTPTLEAPQGQRLHFRRVSEIFSRMGSKGGSGGSGGGGEEEDASSLSRPSSPPESPKGGGLSIRNLFPYRRRRSSVTHLDNTEQFRESREEIIQNTRRRMSSFPPMDGDEAAIMLEKANVIRLEQAHQEALALQSSNAVTNAFRRLRRGSRSPSPMSLNLHLPGLSKKSKWKSSNDVTNSSNAISDLTQCCVSGPKADESPSATTTIITSATKHNNNNNNTSPAVIFPTFPSVQSEIEFSTMAPLLPSSSSSSSRRKASFDVSMIRSPNSFDVIDMDVTTSSTASVVQEQQHPHRRPVFIFPKRKVEDVPGIFIPSKSKKSMEEGSSGPDLLRSSASNLLAVMRDKPRRHSMSDPIFLQNYAAAAAASASSPSSSSAVVTSRPSFLLPRSPYSTDTR